VATHLFCNLHHQAHALLMPKAMTLSCPALLQHVISIAQRHQQCHCMQLAPGLTQQLQPSRTQPGAAAVQLQLLQPGAGCVQQLLQCSISKARELQAELGQAGRQRRKDGRHSREPARRTVGKEHMLCVVALALDTLP
jgi:hypothetical protein